MSKIEASVDLSVPVSAVSSPVATRLYRATSHDSHLALLTLAYALAVIVSSVLAKVAYIDFVLAQEQDVLPYLYPTIPLAFTLCCFFRQMGLLDVDGLLEPIVGYGKMLGALALSFLVLLGGLYLFKVGEVYSRGWLLTWFGLSAVFLIGVRWVAMRKMHELLECGRLYRRVALYGEPSHLQSIKRHLDRERRDIHVCGMFSSRPVEGDSQLLFSGGVDDLIAGMERNSFDRVVIGLPSEDAAAIRRLVQRLAPFSTELSLCTDVTPYPVEVQGSTMIGGLRADVINPIPAAEHHRLLKRLLDLPLAFIALCFLTPFFFLIAAAIKLDSRGPVFFRQHRYGQNNQVFRIVKFRTMSVAEDGAVVKQAERNDPRVTRVGAFLRATSIDELPQLINVLRGEMSIVGPRPHALAHDLQFEQELDLFSSRRRVLPGITGWAQVNGFRGETRSLEQVKQRMQFDLYYIKNWSIWFDIEIMVRTVATVLRGAY